MDVIRRGSHLDSRIEDIYSDERGCTRGGICRRSVGEERKVGGEVGNTSLKQTETREK